MHHVADGHDGVIPSVDSTKEFQEFAHELHKMYVNESWWTRSSMAFLYGACACIITALLLMLWNLHEEPTTSIYNVICLIFILLVAHIKSQNRIHVRFRTEHPEDYKIWQQSRWTYRPEE
jgi:hypothetical protein